MAQTLPSNAQLAEQFELLADLLELDGADAFRLTAYRRAATRIRESAVPVAQLALDKKATRLSGIGATIEGKIVEYTETGDMTAYGVLGEVSWSDAALVGFPAVFGVLIGTWAQQRLPTRVLTLLLSALLVAVAVRLFIG